MKPSWKNKTVLITSGPTREYLDPIRFLTNASSGRMGFALAQEAKRLGAKVLVVSGPCSLKPPRGVRVFSVVTALEMYRQALSLCEEADVVIAAAAVSDWRFESVARHKIKKLSCPLNLTLRPNPDIIKAVREHRRRTSQVLVGFALETHQGLRSARDKMRRKGLDLIVANGPASLAGSRSKAVILSREGKVKVLPLWPKQRIARALLKEAEIFFGL